MHSLRETDLTNIDSATGTFDPKLHIRRFHESEYEDFPRWCCEYPIQKISSPEVASADGPVFVELHALWPDGNWRVAQVPKFWIGFAQTISIQPERCGLIEVRQDEVLKIARRDAASVPPGNFPTHSINKCACCGRLLYSPITE